MVLASAYVLDVYPVTMVIAVGYLFALSLVVVSIAIIHVTDTKSGLSIGEF